jgi:hypothetical protein
MTSRIDRAFFLIRRNSLTKLVAASRGKPAMHSFDYAVGEFADWP